MPHADYSQAIAAINQANNILVVPSSPPDGDSLSSALALYMGLRKKGKTVTVVCADPVPEAFEFLPDINQIESGYENLGQDFIITLDISQSGFKNLKYDVVENKVNIYVTPQSGHYKAENVMINQEASRFDLIITVDTADLSQLGKVYEENRELFTKVPVLNIDHHPSNPMFGSINLVAPQSASTTLMLTELFQAYDISIIDSDIATVLLAGIITDTGSFQNANATPEAFDTAALLIGLGARQQEIIRHVYKTKELHALRLWGRILSNIQTDYQHRLVWSTVTQADFAETNSKETDIGDIIDELLSNAPEAEVVVLFKELKDGQSHVSIRTTTDEINASAIAQQFGGGGHRRAAGATASENFGTVVEKVLEYIRAQQQVRLTGGQPQIVGAMAGVVAENMTAAPVEPVVPVAEPVIEPIIEDETQFDEFDNNEPDLEPLVEPEPQPEAVHPMFMAPVEQAPVEVQPVVQPEPVVPVAEPIMEVQPEIQAESMVQPQPAIETMTAAEPVMPSPTMEAPMMPEQQPVVVAEFAGQPELQEPQLADMGLPPELPPEVSHVDVAPQMPSFAEYMQQAAPVAAAMPDPMASMTFEQPVVAAPEPVVNQVDPVMAQPVMSDNTTVFEPAPQDAQMPTYELPGVEPQDPQAQVQQFPNA